MNRSKSQPGASRIRACNGLSPSSPNARTSSPQIAMQPSPTFENGPASSAFVSATSPVDTIFNARASSASRNSSLLRSSSNKTTSQSMARPRLCHLGLRSPSSPTLSSPSGMSPTSVGAYSATAQSSETTTPFGFPASAVSAVPTLIRNPTLNASTNLQFTAPPLGIAAPTSFVSQVSQVPHGQIGPLSRNRGRSPSLNVAMCAAPRSVNARTPRASTPGAIIQSISQGVPTGAQRVFSTAVRKGAG